MEFEKQIYKIHERLLSGFMIPKIFRAGQYFFSILTIIGLIFLFSLQFRQSYNKFLDSENHEYFNNETIYIFNITDTELQQINESYLSIKFTINKTLFYMNNEFLQKYNFTVITRFIDIDHYYNNKFNYLATDLETMFIIDFLNFYQDTDIQLMNQNTNETWSWNVQQFKNENNYYDRIYHTLQLFIKCVLGIFQQSIVALIYIKMTFICAPVIMIGLVNCISVFFNEDIQAQLILDSFPWIGNYLRILNINHKLKKELIDAFIQMLTLFYMIYFFSFSTYSGSIQLFTKSYPKGLNDRFYSSFLINEFMSTLFLRTRSSIYFVPKYLILIYLLFIYYFESTLYGYYHLAYQICIFSQFTIISFFVFQYEIAALDWSTISPYTPSFDRPRVFYCPMFNMNWVNDIPNFWTLFFPLCGRRYFQIENLAYVDKNVILLNNLLNQEELIPIEQNVPIQIPNLQLQIDLPLQQQPENQQFVINVDNIHGYDQPQQHNQLL